MRVELTEENMYKLYDLMINYSYMMHEEDLDEVGRKVFDPEEDCTVDAALIEYVLDVAIKDYNRTLE